jgi:hypothetical protein
MAILATTIHALTIPVFNYIFSNKGVYNSFQELTHSIITEVLTISLMKQTAFKADLLKTDITIVGSYTYKMLIDTILSISGAYSNPTVAAAWRLKFNLTHQTTPIYWVFARAIN